MAVIGEYGGERFELQNAAEEATLQAILKAVGGKSGEVGNAADMQGFNKAVKEGKGVLAGFTSVLTGTFKFVNTLTQGAGAVVAFGGSLASAQPKITGIAKGFTQLSGNLFGLGQTLETLVGLLQTNYDMFQKLSKTGIAFGTRVEQLTSDFAALGIDSGQLLKTLGQNSEAFANLGTASRGAEMALELNKKAFAANSRTLMKFGLDFDEQNERFMGFFNQNALALQRGTMGQQQVVALSGDYAKYLRQLSEITGKQTEELENQMKSVNLNKGFERFLTQFDGETQARMRKVIGTAEAGFGEAGKEAAMAAIMGVGPVTDAAAQLTAILPGFGTTMQGAATSAKTFQGTQDQFNAMLMGDFNKLANQNQGFADANAGLAGTLMLMGDPLGTAFSNAINGVNLFQGSVDQIQTRMGKTGGTVDTFNELNKSMQEIRLAFANMFTRVFKSGAFQTALEAFKTGLENSVPKITGFLERISTDLNPFTEEGRKKIYEGLSDLLEKIGNKIVDTITGAGGATESSIESGRGIKTDWTDWITGGARIDKDAFKKQAGATGQGRGGFMGWMDERNIEGYLEKVYGEMQGQGVKSADAKKKINEALKKYISNNYEGADKDIMMQFLDGFLADKINALPKYNDGTLAMGSLFQNFGKGKLAMLHGQEAVIPKDSHMGNMLNMMQGEGGMQGMMNAFKSGDIGSVISQGQALGTKLNDYSAQNADAIKAEGRGMVKSMTGLSDEQLDKMEADAVKSKDNATSQSSVNNFNGAGLGGKMDELIRVNKEMLEELRNH